ncbi:hypothetical protein F652_2071 [Enterobacteriaceae bacterium bta3-1]|nr:hypothetical protein F652_2071 [Enterobacteriaceae bacterium bta3-1]
MQIINGEIIDWNAVVISLISAFIGTFGGAYLVRVLSDRKIIKVRKTAISILKKIKKYNKKTFKDFESEFNKNNKYTIASKRATLVVLHKIGVPILHATEQSFDITAVGFLPEVIDEKELDDMIRQIKSGQCDHLFFLDPDSYFNSEATARKRRAIANKFIDKAMVGSVWESSESQFTQTFHDNWASFFSPGEINVIGVFKQKICSPYYYGVDGMVKNDELEKLRSEVDIGIWDLYLSWDIGAFEGMYHQRYINEKAGQLLDAQFKINTEDKVIDK